MQTWTPDGISCLGCPNRSTNGEPSCHNDSCPVHVRQQQKNTLRVNSRAAETALNGVYSDGIGRHIAAKGGRWLKGPASTKGAKQKWIT